MENIHPVVLAEVVKPAPKYTQAQVIFVVTAGVATVVAGAWPIGDLIYRHEFGSPDAWWLLVMVTLVGWIAVLIERGAERSRRNQRLILENMEMLRVGLIELRSEVDAYGDGREAAGHSLAAAIRANGNGSVRQLHPVD